ncbi:MAG: PilN domain-containing protein [Myxococcota bacterium]
MIRVNLLPIKKARKRSAARNQLIIFTVLILAELAACAVIFLSESNRLDTLQSEVQQNQQQVKKAEKAVADANKLKQRQQQLEQQLSVLQELEEKRTGPVRMLDEIQAMLSAPRTKEEGYAQARKNWNTEWDTRRLWVQTFEESEGGFDMTGFAINADDVAEFLQRLTTAEHLYDVQLDYVKATSKGGGGRNSEDMVEFHITGDVSYSGEQGKDAENPQGS